MDYPEKPKVRVAFIDERAYGLAPNGGARPIEPGAYRIADLAGMKNGMIMLVHPDDSLVAMIPMEYAAEIIETVSIKDPVGWATYRRHNPKTLAVWGEQNNRMAPSSDKASQ